MTNEQHFLLQVLQDAVAKRRTEPPADTLDYAAVCAYADSHELAALVYRQCREFLPEPFAARLRTADANALYAYTNYRHAVAQIEQAFAAHGVDGVWIKGMLIADYYPTPYLRTMGDGDVVIAHGEENAEKAMQSVGFTRTGEYEDAVVMYQRSPCLMEVHSRFFYTPLPKSPAHLAYFDAFRDYMQDGEIDHSFHFLYLFEHLRKHLLERGAGLRLFLDLAMLLRYDDTLRLDWIAEQLKHLDLYGFAVKVLACVEYWFGVPMPFSDAVRPDTEFLEEMTAVILENGVFGMQNPQNDKRIVWNESRFAKHKFGVMIRRFFRSVFPSYSSLCANPKFRFVHGKPYLVPIAWIYRLGFALVQYSPRRRKEVLSHTVTHNFISDADAAQFEQFSRKWEL